MNQNKSKDPFTTDLRSSFANDRLFYTIGIALLLSLGGFLRFYNLGALPLDGDNSFHALSAMAINNTGKPLMESGSLYTRSLPLLYLEALSYHLFGISEWSLRFPNAVFGTFNIFLIFLISKMISNENRVAFLAAFFFAISPWAIAVSRMPRMYETLTFTVLLSWILFYNWYFRGSRYSLFPMIFVSMVAISLHKIAILPLACFLSPLFLCRTISKKAIASAVFFLGLFVFWHQYYSILRYLLS